ncbi:uncharacterized protein VDAG_04909 [Verticillium dahliae VdLs.17]|uniref:Uncharacterized protein n=1 Tax=Verticillium dahliae (strain VdLs.17 / ATCC MYA-4575 / FGSC 10137) TaxID=498257 RepID=G2X3C4_VERDV|nr:uncharacterized protein VDAG_04909 [Verticillium dahliae VdLs.17]EGY23471.1 hypothetical protein VDAG_04909 [Verticillium dahliae VdLs.17]
MSSKACPQRYSHLLPQAADPSVLVSQSTESVNKNPTAGGGIAGLSSNPAQAAPAPVQRTAEVASVAAESPLRTSPSPRHSPSPPRYDSPQAIYGRYTAARSAWYDARPRGSIKTNQEYRRAMGLPLRYDKKSYEWCIDYKQMTK